MVINMNIMQDDDSSVGSNETLSNLINLVNFMNNQFYVFG